MIPADYNSCDSENIMRNLLAFVGFVVVGFLGLGWYLGWYSIGAKTNTNGKLEFSGEVNVDKVKGDFGKGLSKTGQFIDSLKKEPAESKPDFVGPTLPADWLPGNGAAAGLPAPKK
jgi:hypothetical protein